ncbi:hypothetical protein [Paenarthrobacter sp. 22069]|uniref:hypothetical protein n=1 Tax=Paenarthrobacter sp. 22069 TaxID=3453864 RepID=UPI003F862A1F
MKVANGDRQSRIRETAQLLKRGVSKDQIAQTLGVHPRTIDDYEDELLNKPTKSSRAAARRENRGSKSE